MTHGAVNAAAGSYQPLHRHCDARLVMFLGGALLERASLKAAHCTPGDFVIRPSFFAHDGAPGDAGACYLRLGLSAGAVRRFFTQHGWDARRGRATFDRRTIAELADDPCGGDRVLEIASTTTYENETTTSPFAAVAAALQADEAPALGALAEAHGLDPWQLTRKFARAFGISPQAYRMQARLQRALKLIAETETRLSAIAAIAGFADQSHLSRLVKRATGLTPNSLRRRIAIN